MLLGSEIDFKHYLVGAGSFRLSNEDLALNCLLNFNIIDCKGLTDLAKILCICLLSFLFSEELLANHLVGGELSYECIGGNQFEITLKIYRDCDVADTGATAGPFDDPAYIWLYDDNDNLLEVYGMSFFENQIQDIEPDTDDICLESIPIVCVEAYEYKRTIDLTPLSGGYKLIYQRCCRNSLILNVAPETGSTYEILIPHEGLACDNSSPVFNNDPPLIICEDFRFDLDFSATDLDGDSLVYEVCNPFNGAGPNAPAPSPGTGPGRFDPFDYNFVNWSNGFNVNNQLGNASTFEINAETGLLTVKPSDSGLYVVGVCVSEFRDGEFLTTSVRDFQFEISPCNVVSASIGGTAIEVTANIFEVKDCSTFDIFFENTSQGASSYFWDFGDNTSTTDISNEVSPHYSYPDSGKYEILLVADPGEVCTDTSFIDLTLFPFLIGDWRWDGGTCKNETFNFFDESVIEPLMSEQEANSWNWSFGDSTFSTLRNPTHLYSLFGEYDVSLTVGTNFGCEQTITQTITVNPVPNLSVDFEGACVGEAILFDARVNIIHEIVEATWDFDDPGSPDNTSNQEDASHIYNSPGDYIVQVSYENQFGCIRERNVPVTIFPAIQADLGSGLTACAGEDIQINASISGGDPLENTFQWSPAEMLSDSTILNPILTTDENVTLELIATDPNGCEDVQQVFIEINPLPVIDLEDSIVVCFMQTAQLDAILESNTTGFLWSPDTNISDVNLIDPVISPTDTTTYYLTVENSFGCVKVDSVVAVVLPEINVPPLNGIEICEGDSMQIQLPFSSATDFDWSPADGLSSATAENPIAFPETTTTYIVDLSNECFSDQSSVTVIVNPLPFVDAGEDVEVIIGESETLNGSAEFDYLWEPNLAIDDNTIPDPTITPLIGTNYTLSTTSDKGCVGIDSVAVTISTDTELLLPTAFSPNNDGLNDEFRIISKGIRELVYYRIYNRWGDLLFESTDVELAWDGNYEGEPQPAGVYVIVVRAKRPIQSDVLVQGNVTLIR